VKLDESTAISRPAMERALGKLVLEAGFRDAFFSDRVVAAREANIELTDRERDALACIRPGALAAFRRYLDAKWTLGLGEVPAVTLTTEVRNEQTTQCPRRLIS
jgi:hypothetical protein